MPKSRFLEKADKYLFDDTAMDKFTAAETSKLYRFREAFTLWINDPTKSELTIVEYLIKHHNISRTQAYRDMFDIKILLGNVTMARKEWERYRATTMINEGFALAKNAIDKLDILRADQMIKAGKAMAPVQKLSVVEPEETDWDKINVPNMEPVHDPKLIDENYSKKEVDEITAKLKRDLGLTVSDAEIVE